MQATIHHELPSSEFSLLTRTGLSSKRPRCWRKSPIWSPMASSCSFIDSRSASTVVGPGGRQLHIVRSHSYCAGSCRVSRYKKPTLVPTASMRSVPRWHISMMEARTVGLHIMCPCSADTAAAGIEPGFAAPEYHGLACGGRHLGQSHSTMMSSWATTTPIVRKPQAVLCFQSVSRKSGKPLSAIAPPGSSVNSTPMAARTATAVSKLTMDCLPYRVVLPTGLHRASTLTLLHQYKPSTWRCPPPQRRIGGRPRPEP